MNSNKIEIKESGLAILNIPRGAKVYNPQPRVEICRNCHGLGLTDESSLFRREKGRCPVCNGTGRVVKTITLAIEVRPYEQEG